jgi:hypothetical protein
MKAQFPSTLSQIQQIGLPPFYQTILGTSQVPTDILVQASDPQFDEGVVVSLPSSASKFPAVKVSLSDLDLQCRDVRRVQVDLARRSNCFLPSIASPNSKDPVSDAKLCAKPRELKVKLQVVIDGKPVAKSAATTLKSRFNFEWGPYNLPSYAKTGKIELNTLPVAWETAVMEIGMDQCQALIRGGGKGELEVLLDASESSKPGKISPVDFLYIGVVRKTAK